MNVQTSPAELVDASGGDVLICFSHLRWDFVLQRPQHLMHRFAAHKRVFFFEEPIPCDHHLAYLEYHPFEGTGVVAVRPRLPRGWNEVDQEAGLRRLLDLLLVINRVERPLLWFYTPMMFGFAEHVAAAAIVYDCMDELANFHFAPARLKALEARLIERADVVFTGGYSLYEAKRGLHDNIHPFPSSVDAAHFGAARARADATALPGKRFGFYGVIDERMDLELLAAVAAARPDWTFEIVGPVVKIGADDLPRLPNLSFPGASDYADLPAHLSRWHVALMPFRIDATTRYISPTKTPEYLAAGKPVVSTPIPDVVRQYGDVDGVRIADGPARFVEACEAALLLAQRPQDWLPQVDALLDGMSWDGTFGQMRDLVDAAVTRNGAVSLEPPIVAAPVLRRRRPPYDVQIVGAGFAGSVMAERLASSGRRVLVCDRRPHIAGNAFDHYDPAGILVHKYGPHIFHTNSRGDLQPICRSFTALAAVPASRAGRSVDEHAAAHPHQPHHDQQALRPDRPRQRRRGSEAFLAKPGASRWTTIRSVGGCGRGHSVGRRPLSKSSSEGYTRKQWGLDPDGAGPSR